MTDLEMVRLCAEAMGYSSLVAIPTVDSTHRAYSPPQYAYCPLHDDAQAMELVKKFKLLLGFNTKATEPRWEAQNATSIGFGDGYPDDPPNGLNRAIVECVAKAEMVRRKEGVHEGVREAV